jgi:hypothetical protein
MDEKIERDMCVRGDDGAAECGPGLGENRV